MGTVGDLIARLLCDSSDFDSNINKSQKEVQEFKRKTEREAAAINNTFNNMGSAAGKLSSTLGNVISSFGRVSVVAAVGTAAFEGFKQVIQQSESAMDDLDKKTEQLNGAWEHITTTISNGNIFSGMVSSLRESVRLAGELQEIIDDLGTLSGYHKLNTSEAESNIAKLKELKRSGASKEEINKQIAKTKASIVRFDTTSGKIVADLKLEFNNLLEGLYEKVMRGGRVGLKAGTHFIDKFATDTDWRDSIVSWSNYLGKFKNFVGVRSESALSPLKTDKPFEEFLKKSKIYDSYLFKAFKEGKDEGYEYIRDVISLVTGTVDKKEDSKYGIVNIQNAKTEWLDTERERSETHNSFYKQYNDIINKPGKGGGGNRGSVYTSKQEAPKERTLQDIQYDLDKSLAWNKYIAQNLGKDVAGDNLSAFNKAISELMDLLKNTTDEEQRKNILSVLKTIYNTVNKPKEAKKSANNANFDNIYGNEIGNLSLNNTTRKNILSGAVEAKDWEIAFRDAFKGDEHIKVNLDNVVLADTARKYNYNADEYFKNKLYRNIDEYNKKVVQSIFDIYKSSDNRFLNSEERYKPAPNSNNKISSFIPFGELSKLDIPIKYPEKFYYEREASSKFSSGVASIVKKYTGFDTFRRDFARNAYSEFDRLISEGNIITPDDVNKILYKVYLNTIEKHIDTTPDFFKESSDFVRFIDKRTNTNNFNNDKEKLKANLLLGEKNKNELIYQELLNSISVPKEAKVAVGDNMHTVNTKSRAISPINLGTGYIIDFINELSNGDIYEKAEILRNIKSKLTERREALTNLAATVDTGEDRTKLKDGYKKLRLIQLEKEKRSNKGVLSEENQKEYEDLKKETDMDFSDFTNVELDTTEESFTRDAEKLAKAIEEANSIRKDLEDKINQNDDIGNRIQEEEDENNVLRERQKVLLELSNKYMSVADSAYQIGAAFSTLDSKFGDIASVLLNVVGITAEAIGKLIGMATAKGVSNAFSLPWPQNLAAVATVVAAGASAAGQIAGLASKKYATGGIVSGPGTSISDSIPIRVSNGEMILNHRQQSNLFNLLDKGSGTEGKIEFKNKLVGSDIIGSATTYNKRRNLIL